MSDIAVLIPYFNHPHRLEKSLLSISGDEKVDVIIVDDGSWEKLDLNDLIIKFPQIPSIEIIAFEKNRGLSHALNYGLEYILSKGSYKYIARLDVGDLCKPDRFKEQRSFLKDNPEISLVGSHANMLDEDGNLLYIRKYPLTHQEIRKYMFLFSSFMHPAVMFKTSILYSVGLYSLNTCQDYAFFFKIIKKFKSANIDKILIDYEVNAKGITYSRYRKFHREALLIILKNFEVKFCIYACIGIMRRIICIILGPKLMLKIGNFIRKY